MSMPKDPRAGAATLGGIALIAVGLLWLVQVSGIIPSFVFDVLTRAVPALVVVGLGVVVLWVSRRGTFTMPASGTRLYRSRSDRWLGGVLGGLGAYLGIDPLILRISTILLTLLGAGTLVVAYIIMWVIVPEQPLTSSTPAEPPAPPAPSADGS
jgi:phage shock protein PspC (stress-responsive transcriptional regulator)